VIRKPKVSIKTTLLLAGLVLIFMLGSIMGLFWAWNERQFVNKLITQNVQELIVTTELNTSLFRQRGLVASYILSDGDKRLVEELKSIEPDFRALIEQSKEKIEEQSERTKIQEIIESYARYDAKRREVIALYDSGEKIAAKNIYLTEVNRLYDETLSLCNQIVEKNKNDIENASLDARRHFSHLVHVMTSIVTLSTLFGAVLLWLIYHKIFIPMKQISKEISTFVTSRSGREETLSLENLAKLGYYFNTLLTEIDQTRSDLEKSHQELQHSERLASIGNAVAHIAHEVRNHLTQIGGFAHSIESHPENQEHVCLGAQIIYQQARNLERMMNDVMEYSKPVRIEPIVQSLNGLVKETIDLVAPQMPEGVSLLVSLDPATPEVPFDSLRIEQVLINLLRNAVEAMKGGGTIRISTHPYEDGAALFIQDNGPGIPENIQQKIFEPFFTTKKKGNGIGLAVCQQIVSEHSGSITVESSTGNGATFKVILYKLINKQIKTK